MSEILEFCGVRCYEEDGVAHLHIEDVARGLGFDQEKNGAVYVRWDRVEQHLSDLDFPTSGENRKTHDFYIPENIFYRLCMKANNSYAKKFQETVANEVLPKIRKHGVYMTDKVLEQTLSNPDFLINILQEYKKEKAEKEKLIAERDELKRTKAFISAGREATAVARLGGTTKALVCEREKNTKLLKENIELIKEKEKLKIRLSESDNYKTIRQMTVHLKKYIKTDTKSLQRLGKEMARISMEMSFKVIKVPDPLYEEVNSYHTEVWRETFAKLNNDPLFLIDIRK